VKKKKKNVSPEYNRYFLTYMQGSLTVKTRWNIWRLLSHKELINSTWYKLSEGCKSGDVSSTFAVQLSTCD
jgi:hypothetical protein